jgi:glycosyltransferase involved in cell wall biosynthesis
VWFYGACYDERQIAELIYNADLCIAPGNIGLTAMHSLVFGCPAISHNDFKWQMPEFESIHPGITGDFFEMGNVESLADIISRWFAEHKGKREEIRQACYNEIDTYWTPEFELSVLKNALDVLS